MAYEEKYRTIERPHEIVIEGRSKLSVTGVDDVESFDEETIIANTVKGTLLIHGSGLKLEKLSLENGEIAVEGSIDSVEYEDEGRSNEGFFSRIFK